MLNAARFNDCLIVVDVQKSLKGNDIIIANRLNDEIREFEEKVRTRNLLGRLRRQKRILELI